ncbi:hypothetical protein L1887_05046 [Cichorium endivia]|nr:hypothetical protein L1887_05046 [Cichorium endivia]
MHFPVNETGATISVVHHLTQKYNIAPEFPHLQAIQAGTDTKPSYFPGLLVDKACLSSMVCNSFRVKDETGERLYLGRELDA